MPALREDDLRVYIVTDRDLERLLAEIDRDPQYGQDGGSSQVLTDAERAAFQTAHRFYNYAVRRWIDAVKEPWQ